MAPIKIPTFTLARTGDKIPAVGFGSGTKHRIRKQSTPGLGMQVRDDEITNVIVSAIDSGFSHLDTAESYLTRIEVGDAVEKSGIDRSKLWITDKWDQGWVLGGQTYPSHSPSGPYESLKEGLKLLKTDHVELFLIHGPFFTKETSNITIEEAWKQMEQLVDEKLTRNIGVSNFDIEWLEKILKVCKYKPQVNQIEYHLYLQQEPVVEFCRKHEILIEGYSPLTPIRPEKFSKDVNPLKPVVEELSKKYNVDPSLLLLRWVYQSGVLPITTSSNPERQRNTFKFFDFKIDPEDFDRLKSVGQSVHFRGNLAEQLEKNKN
ncbi:DEKNAAC100755 [Brettanomyces naardenensis]|uniref:2-dehydropantolactone reductase n=1 Tax=Brettanomyces naardenensis TaxID=13370 RepID=A0A448YF44_BRENA|nr:DEKNAAC100755 [Brettanomyces naardenensis]